MQKQEDYDSYAPTQSSHSRKKKQKKTVEVLPSNLLGFIPPSSESEQEYIPRPRNKRKDTHKRQVQRKYNFRSRHHFILEADAVSAEQMLAIDLISPLQCFNHPITCPICLNGTTEITDPLITACGHVFCSPCILRHIKVSNKQFNCPVCNEYVNKDELKPCSFLGQKSVGDNKLSYILRIRSAGSNIVYDSQTLKQDLNFSKFIRVTKQYLLEQLEKQKTSLQNHLHQYLSQGQQQNVPYITQAMDLVNQKIFHYKLQLSYPSKKPKNIQNGKYYSTISQQGKNKAIYFYQQQYGRLIFLHPICNHYLCQQFLSNEHLPLVINSNVEYKQSISLDAKTLRRYKYLNHLPQDTQVIFAEINMINYLQKATLDLYNKEMNRHKDKIKEREDQDDKRNQEIISKRLAKKIAKQQKYQHVVKISEKDREISDLKSCNKDQNFPSLPSQMPVLHQQMSEPIPAPPVLKEPVHNISMKEFDFPEIKAQSNTKNQKRTKGKRSRKHQQIDITTMMFQAPEDDF